MNGGYEVNGKSLWLSNEWTDSKGNVFRFVRLGYDEVGNLMKVEGGWQFNDAYFNWLVHTFFPSLPLAMNGIKEILEGRE